MEYLPICLRLQAVNVLLVGGGKVATRKARLLLRAGAYLTVVAPEVSAELAVLLEQHKGLWLQSRYASEHIKGQSLVIAATPDKAVNAQVHQDAGALGLPVNVVDTPELCSFIFPAIVDRSPLLVAVSSSGHSPVLARKVRRDIEALLPAASGRLAEFAGRMRPLINERIHEEGPRRLFLEEMVDGAVAELVLAGREAEAEKLMREQLADLATLKQGEVYLIGAGPGDPDLMTFKAARLLQRADVVLYDRLVNPAIVDMARRDAERVYVGKRRADHAVPQQDINRQLLELAQQGKRVARLKGGDPFIFGRGGEEIELLFQHHIPFQVVPGITAASGAACYAGIPLTHRDYAQSVRFVAGYLKGNEVRHDWSEFLSETETLVFYMGLVGLGEICTQLQTHGRALETPVALVEQATLPTQKTLVGTLATIEAIVAEAKPQAPTLIIVGNVVRLHRELAWFAEEG
ncbi:uroporphyrinogen-III C-methyltransferase [Parahaliea sp. F7430]|uniref:Siroheme synthase n=1 Tax=Sediminihaliea albiluteola TaxID=2758564 RepID=A0A7W2YJ56_9GAMM|nr:siroheme synthase CysG [Sediminihaliea albiluteola]MBA6412279.1 uroporphyrinogen-III C-methyltransferase [Sediminihaliea albiluteola]